MKKTVIIRFEKYGFDIVGKINKVGNTIIINGNKIINHLIISSLQSNITLIGLDIAYKKHNINGELKIYDSCTNNVYNCVIQINDKQYKEIDVYDSDENCNSTKKLEVCISNKPLYPLGIEVNANMQLKIEIF